VGQDFFSVPGGGTVRFATGFCERKGLKRIGLNSSGDGTGGTWFSLALRVRAVDPAGRILPVLGQTLGGGWKMWVGSQTS